MLNERTTLGKGGRLVIPAAYRKALGVVPGDELIVILEQGELRIMTPSQAVRLSQAMVRRYVPQGTPLVDDLLADRREENARA